MNGKVYNLDIVTEVADAKRGSSLYSYPGIWDTHEVRMLTRERERVNMCCAVALAGC